VSTGPFPPFFEPLTAGPLLGEQGEQDAFIWAQATNTTPLTLSVFPPNSPIPTHWRLTPKAEEFNCVVFHVTGLNLPGTYEYQLSSNLGTTSRFKLRRPPREDAKRVRIIFGSCIRQPAEAAAILGRMARDHADLIMLVGDNTYFQVDPLGRKEWESEDLMMAAHLRWRRAEGMRELCGNTSTLAIWDDHDYGENDTGAHNPAKFTALRCFKRMWAQRKYGNSETVGIFSSVRCGPVQLFLLDVRFHRARGKLIASHQMQWLMDSLRFSNAPVKLIVSGSQMLPEGALDPDRNWECWRRDGKGQLDQLFRFLAEHQINGVVLISGDVHLGQLMFTRGHKLDDGTRGGDLWELTSSPLTEPTEMTEHGDAIMHGPKRLYDRYMIREVVEPNYGVIDIDLERIGEEIMLGLAAVDRPLFHVDIDLDSLHVRHPRPPKIRAFGAGFGRRKAFFFRGDTFILYDIAERKVISGPQPINSRWPGFKGGFDTGIEWPTGSTYFFAGNGYRLWTESAEAGSEWTYISDFFDWPLKFRTGIDAVLLWHDGHAYAFKGRDYIKFNINTRITVGNFPQPIAKWWHDVWAKGIDAAVPGPDGKIYFFRGNEYISYDVHKDWADGPPKPIAPDWPGLIF
jgi:alkaline phosphatase D